MSQIGSGKLIRIQSKTLGRIESRRPELNPVKKSIRTESGISESNPVKKLDSNQVETVEWYETADSNDGD